MMDKNGWQIFALGSAFFAGLTAAGSRATATRHNFTLP